ncbi:MAG: YhcH/YjgK/YiaL family protein [Succinivibrio sp.]|nr:YhcH/YjgK/YiaL family protein [Succinivibrio sp.]
MILDKTTNIKLYASLLPNLQAALDKIASLGTNPEPGRYEFEGGFFMVQKGTTNPVENGDFEAHRKYIDVQIIFSGSELVVWDDIDCLKTTEVYNAEKDREMLAGKVEHIYRIDEGMFWVAFPSDAHKACKHQGSPNEFGKYVVKLPVA